MDINAIARMYSLTRANGGGTFDAKGRKITPTIGYAVGLTNRTAIGWPSFKAAVLAAHFNGARFIGTWEDEEFIYVDNVVLAGELEAAFTIARNHDQKAIYGFAEKAVIEVPPAEPVEDEGLDDQGYPAWVEADGTLSDSVLLH